MGWIFASHPLTTMDVKRRSGLRLKCRLSLFSSLKCIWYISSTWTHTDLCHVSQQPWRTDILHCHPTHFFENNKVMLSRDSIMSGWHRKKSILYYLVFQKESNIFIVFTWAYSFALAFLCPVSMIKCINSPHIIMTTTAWMFNWRHNEGKRVMELFQMKAPLRKHGSCNKA